MYFLFAWRYFRAKKSAQAINIIAWVTTAVIGFATCCQLLVLSVYNGFEDLVQSLYSSFYTDIKIVPAKGNTLTLDERQWQALKKNEFSSSVSAIAEEKALLQNGELQTMIKLKGVDSLHRFVAGISGKVIKGKYDLGSKDEPGMVIGLGVQQAAGISLDPSFATEPVVVFLPKKGDNGSDPLSSLSEGVIYPKGVFVIQQEFDNIYAITDIDFVKTQTRMASNEFSAIEIKLNPNVSEKKAIEYFQKIAGKNQKVLSRYEQNSSLYKTMQLEKWFIFAVLCLILIIAAFNMISALTMLVLEKKKDIAVLKSFGASITQIRNIFLSEGLLLGLMGTGFGMMTAFVLGFIQQKTGWIKIQGESFVIDSFPIRFLYTDFIIIFMSSMMIVLLASWLPARRAGNEKISNQM
jgi:lipoprotein-releasing system permease protein